MKKVTSKDVLAQLARIGLLLEADNALPSVTLMVARKPIRGSWWGIAEGAEIYNLLGEVAGLREVAFAKLINGKITLVHRSLWAALLGAALSGEAWQTDGLSKTAQALLKRVRRSGVLQTSGVTARELEGRLLAHGTSVHTDSGAHAKALQTWERWARGRNVKPARWIQARRMLEDAVVRLGGGRLPWN